MDAGIAVKQQGAENDLLDRIAADPIFGLDRAEIDRLIDVRAFTGRAAEQTDEYLTVVNAVLAENRATLAEQADATINV